MKLVKIYDQKTADALNRLNDLLKMRDEFLENEWNKEFLTFNSDSELVEAFALHFQNDSFRNEIMEEIARVEAISIPSYVIDPE